MKNSYHSLRRRVAMKDQLGLTTLAITLMLLIIITLVVLFSTNVAFFEQRTTNNENRARMTEQAAEYALNLSGEFLKANVANIVTTGSGWLGSGGTRRWTLCSSVASMTATHPCMAERDGSRRSQLYFYSFNGSAALPYNTTSMGAGVLTGIGGDSGSEFTATTTVEALLCRLDTTTLLAGVLTPQCRAIPDTTSANRIAVVLLANVRLAGENSRSVVKETWASISSSVGVSAVPLVAAGTVKGSGTVTIVSGPNGGGFGIPVSVWSPCPVKVSAGTEVNMTAGCPAPGSGNASVQSCELDAFLKTSGTTETAYKAYCAPAAGGNSPCNCPGSGEGVLSAGGSTKIERHDILDRDGGFGQDDAQGIASIPDIQFFPTSRLKTVVDASGTLELDKQADKTDDNMFEWIFGVDVVPDNTLTVPNNCGPTPGGSTNCAEFALYDKLGGTEHADCSFITNATAATLSGLHFVTGTCSIANAVKAIGSPTSPVILVINGDVSANQPFVWSNSFFGMLFVRSNTDNASFKTTGGTFLGSVVVEGTVEMTGNPVIIYNNIQAETPGKPLPANTRFAKVTGSWLDSNTGF